MKIVNSSKLSDLRSLLASSRRVRDLAKVRASISSLEGLSLSLQPLKAPLTGSLDAPETADRLSLPAHDPRRIA